jgi:hypothetical protein
VSNEPSLGEISRRLEDIRSALDGLVGRREYDADQRALDRQFRDVSRAIDELRRDHDEDIKAVHQRISDHARADSEHRASWRTVIYTGLIPAAVVLLGTLLQLFLISRGGH